MIDLSKEFYDLIKNTSSALGKQINMEYIDIVDRGVPHVPRSLPFGKMAVYVFIFNETFLKIGKVGANSNARFLSQHYNPASSASNLAISILTDHEMSKYGITSSNVGDWIKKNCRRIDIFIDAKLGMFTLDLIEAILHYKYEPQYEGFLSQR